MVIMTYVILLVFLQLTNASDNANSKLIDKAVYVTRQYYKLQWVTSVIWSDSDSEGVDEFLKKFPGTIVTTTLSDNNNSATINIKRRLGYEQTVVFASEIETFKKFCNLLNVKLKFPLRLVLVLKSTVGESPDISTFTGAAWKNNLADVVIISKSRSEEITLTTYFPYTNSGCGNIIPVTLKPGENIFPNKFTNFNKCAIRVCALNIEALLHTYAKNDTITGMSGTDGVAFMLIANKLNATLTLKKTLSFGSYRNETVSGALRDIVYDKADIIVPGAVLNGRYLIAQSSHVYYSADMRWVGPKRRQIYQWFRLMIPFFNNVTPFLLLAFTVFVIVTIIIRRVRNVCRRHETGSVSFQAFTLLLGQSVNYVTKWPLLNSLFLLWIWFCFIIRLTYQGYLVDSLQSRILEPPFGSLEEALKTVNGYGGSEGMSEFYKGTPLERHFTIIKTVEAFFSYLNRIVDGERLMLIIDKISRQRFRHSIQILDTPISSTMVCFYMRLEWPGAQAVDTIVVRLLEAGIIQKIHNMGNGTTGERTDKHAQPLDLVMISSCFYIMGFMWFVCSFIFLIEILYYKHSQVSKTVKESLYLGVDDVIDAGDICNDSRNMTCAS